MGFLIFLFSFAALLTAWGLRSVPAGKQWLPVIFGKRIPKRLTEGLVWLPRWLFQYEEFDITEEEFHVLNDNKPGVQQNETIMTSNGVEVVVRSVVGYFTIARKDPDGKRSWLRFLGWQSGYLLLAYSQVRGQDVINRVPPIILNGLRMLIPTYSFQELLGLSIDGLDMPPADRETIRTNRSSLQDQLIELALKHAQVWGLTITRITVGDIDPNKDLKQALQLKAKALLQRTALLIESDADAQRAKIVLKAGGNENPKPDELMDAIVRLRTLDNQRIAAENGGNLGRLAQNLVEVTGRVAANA